jgi:hypothetical protein
VSLRAAALWWSELRLSDALLSLRHGGPLSSTAGCTETRLKVIDSRAALDAAKAIAASKADLAVVKPAAGTAFTSMNTTRKRGRMWDSSVEAKMLEKEQS